MNNELKVGEPGFGVEGATVVPPEPPPITTKGPEWDKFMDPKRYVKPKQRPRELPVPAVPKKGGAPSPGGQGVKGE